MRNIDEKALNSEGWKIQGQLDRDRLICCQSDSALFLSETANADENVETS